MNTMHDPGAPPGVVEDVAARWADLDVPERVAAFCGLAAGDDDELFLSLSTENQAELLLQLPPPQRRVWMRALAPDDAADVLQCVPTADRDDLLGRLDPRMAREVRALLAYEEDVAGGLMSPRFARIRPETTVQEALAYLRRQARADRVETLYVVYVLDARQRLQGVVSFRELFAADPAVDVDAVMQRDVVSVRPGLHQEAVARIIADHDLLAVPVVDDDGVMQGVITVDDLLDVVSEEATEDMHKLGGLAALDAGYLDVSLGGMIKKRAPWLAVLFVGELLTASAMAHYEDAIAKAVVLAMFVPLIISSGGNSGSQATTLVIRAMALGEVRPRDLGRVFAREAASGLALGLLLAVLGFVRVLGAEALFGSYGAVALPMAITVSVSLLGVVAWGSLAGGLLPLLLRRIGLDPASASAPFVATLVDVSGLVIYFSVARAVLGITGG